MPDQIAPDLSAEDVTSLDFVLQRTKQVRKRLDLTRPVDRSVLLRCIEVASRAPIGGNMEVNRWIVVDDPERKKVLSDLYNSYAIDYLAAGREGLEAAPDSPAKDRANRVVESSEFLLHHMADVPALVIPVRFGPHEDHSTFGQATFWGSVLPGVWSFQVAARAHGLGSAWTTLHLARDKDAAELLGIPDGVVQTALLPVAHFTGETFTPAPRRSPESITYFNQWGSKVDD